MTKPLLIVTPTLGHSPHWAAMLASIAELRTPHLHCIVCPTTVRNEVVKRHPSALVIAEKPGTLGLYDAINQGVAAAGLAWEWLTYINDDDLIYPGVDTYLRGADPQAELCYGEVDKIDEDGVRIEPISTLRSPSLFLPLASAGISGFNQQGALLRQRLWFRAGPFDTSLRSCADLDLFIRAALVGGKLHYIPHKTGAFRIRGGQISQDVALEAREKKRIFIKNGLDRFTGAAPAAVRRFRLQNAGSYLRRVIRGKFYTSHQMLSGAKW